MSNENTYWNHNGKHQDVAEAMNSQVPSQGVCTPGSLLELFRVASNAYYDLYNNGMGNAEVRLPPLVAQFDLLRLNGTMDQAPDPVKDAVREIAGFLDEYAEAQENSGWVTVEDDDDEYWEDGAFPATGCLYEPFEVFMDFVLELCLDCEDVSAPFKGPRKAA